MADVLTGSPFLTNDEAPRERKPIVQRLLLGLVIALSVVLIAELVYHLVIAPRLAITNIRVQNNTSIPDQTLLSAAGIQIGMMYFGVDARILEEELSVYPEIRDATVELVFPNTLNLRVTARQPLAHSTVQTDRGNRAVIFDEQGVVFSVLSDSASPSLPVISGLSFPSAEPGLELPNQLDGFLEDLRQLRSEAPELFGLFSEYRVVRKNDALFDVVLYPVHFNVPVRIGRTIDAGMVEYIVMMLETLRREGRLGEIAEIDFRTGEGVLRAKGGDRG